MSLGVILDQDLKLDKLKSVLSFTDLKTVINAVVTSRLDYCNALYLGISQTSLSRLQLVQNSAARLLTGTRSRDYITPILASLHWLPVKYRIEFKILLFVFQSLHGLPPRYISDLLCPTPSHSDLQNSCSWLFLGWVLEEGVIEYLL